MNEPQGTGSRKAWEDDKATSKALKITRGRYELPYLLAGPHVRWSDREIQPGIGEEIFLGNCKWGCVGMMHIYVDQWQGEKAGA